MKILLVQPPFSPESIVPPLGLASIASSLILEDYDVQVKDFNLQWKRNIDEMVKEALRADCDLIGLTCWGNMAPFCIEFSKKIKEKDPSIKIILGGEIATFLFEKLLKTGFIDFIVKGEGEKTIVDLIKTLENGGKPYKVKGIAYIDKNRIISTEMRQPCELDSLPLPAWNLFDSIKEYQKIRPFVMPIQASRGCPFNCIFCSIHKTWYGIQRKKSPLRVIDEIIFLIENYDVDAVMFYDDTFNIDKEWVKKICKNIIQKEIKINWSIMARPDLIDEDLLSLLKNAGCNNIYYGIEHVSPRILNFIRKNISNEISKRCIKKSIEKGILTEISVIYGFPIETRKEMIALTDECLEYLAMGVQAIHQHILAPYPGTDITSMYRHFIIPNPLVNMVIPSLINIDLLYSYAEFVPDLWMFENFNMSNDEVLKLYLDARIRIGSKEIFF
ncbi:MAG: radical SAM protein [Candidatus Bathyarchaeia archaeon]